DSSAHGQHGLPARAGGCVYRVSARGRGGAGGSPRAKDRVCDQPYCIQTAARLLGSMRMEVDPCNNFYEFACGKWVAEHRVPEYKGSIDTMEEVSDRLERDIQDLLESPDRGDIEPERMAKPSLLLEGKDMYDDGALVTAYIRYASGVAEALGATPEVAQKHMTDMVNFERDLAKFDWLRYLQLTFGDAEVTIETSEPVVLWMKPYYDGLFPLLNRTSTKTIANYLVWRLITKQFISLHEKFSLKRLAFRKVTEGVKELKSRGLRCSEITNEFLDSATGRMWPERPAIVNAYYHSGLNAIGRAFDEKGLLENWWSNYSTENFNKRSQCVAYKLWLREHNNHDIRLPGLTRFSNEQLFFINTAQLWCSKFTDEAARRSVFTSVHSLPMFRCPRGSYMNPDEEKCSLW
ncbi:NEP2-like protein, partial [Mya arenaria]